MHNMKNNFDKLILEGLTKTTIRLNSIEKIKQKKLNKTVQ